MFSSSMLSHRTGPDVFEGDSTSWNAAATADANSPEVLRAVLGNLVRSRDFTLVAEAESTYELLEAVLGEGSATEPDHVLTVARDMRQTMRWLLESAPHMIRERLNDQGIPQRANDLLTCALPTAERDSLVHLRRMALVTLELLDAAGDAP